MQVNLEEVSILKNSDMFEKVNLFGESMVMLENNTYNHEVDSLIGKPKDDFQGKVYIFDSNVKKGIFSCEIQCMQTHHPQKKAWTGLVFRAEDVENFELVSLMPFASKDTVAYISVAYGIIPWWTTAYQADPKASIELKEKEWIKMEISMEEFDFTVSINGEKMFTKKYSYFLKPGKCGFFVGSGTDATFRNFRLESHD